MQPVLNASKGRELSDLTGPRQVVGARTSLLSVVRLTCAAIVLSPLSLALAGDELSIRPEVFGSLVQEDGTPLIDTPVLVGGVDPETHQLCTNSTQVSSTDKNGQFHISELKKADTDKTIGILKVTPYRISNICFLLDSSRLFGIQIISSEEEKSTYILNCKLLALAQSPKQRAVSCEKHLKSTTNR
jgi:hypothetical protein